MPIRPDLSRLTPSQLHELTGRDRRWIKRRLAERGVEPVAVTARERRYPARPALEALYAVDDLDPAQEHGRLARARAQLAEQELRVRRGELVEGDAVESYLIQIFGAVVQRLRAVPVKAAAEARATASDAEAEALIASLQDEALIEIADAARSAGDFARQRVQTRRTRIRISA